MLRRRSLVWCFLHYGTQHSSILDRTRQSSTSSSLFQPTSTTTSARQALSLSKVHGAQTWHAYVRAIACVQAILCRPVPSAESKTLSNALQGLITCSFAVQATLAAAEIAQLHVLHIINEPTAAALAFGCAAQDARAIC